MHRFLILCLMVVFAGGCDAQLGVDVGKNLSNVEAATQSLTAIGDAYSDAIREAEAEGLGLILAIAFEGEANGAVSGTAEWQGNVDTGNADFTITFGGYQVATDDVFVDGDVQVAVSRTGDGCSGTMSIVDVPFSNEGHDYEITATGTGLTLTSEGDCENMNVTGRVNVSGDATGDDCIVTGTTNNFEVSC